MARPWGYPANLVGGAGMTTPARWGLGCRVGRAGRSRPATHALSLRTGAGCASEANRVRADLDRPRATRLPTPYNARAQVTTPREEPHHGNGHARPRPPDRRRLPPRQRPRPRPRLRP